MCWGDSLPRSEDRRARYATTYMTLGDKSCIAIIEFVPGAADRYPVRVVRYTDGEGYENEADELLDLCERWNEEADELDDEEEVEVREEVGK